MDKRAGENVTKKIQKWGYGGVFTLGLIGCSIIAYQRLLCGLDRVLTGAHQNAERQ